MHFLDLHLTVVDGRISFKNYFKPRNLFMYTPFTSHHAISVKKGIIHTEVQRMFANNEHRSDFEASVDILKTKFIARWYPTAFVNNCIAGFEKSQALPRVKDERPLICFKPPYTDSTSRCGFMHSLRKHFSLLPGVARFNTNIVDIQDGSDILATAPWRFVTCFTSSLNLFRRRYSRFLGSSD